MLRIRRKSKKTENHRVTTLKRWKRGDDNELESNLRLEKVVTSKQLSLAMETSNSAQELTFTWTYHGQLNFCITISS